MTETSTAKGSREGPAETADPSSPGHSLGTLFRSWLRATVGSKNGADWRETIEDLIEDGDNGADPSVATHERMLLANILRLKDLTAYDVMIPRADIFALDVATPLPDALRQLSERAHSRVPVFHETLDDVVGMVHIKDLLGYLDDPATGQMREATLADLRRDLLIVAPSMPLLDLLLEMRQNRQQMALVVDEFGGIDGLVTIEDLVEEIVGDIEDEHEADTAPELITRPDGTWLADARVLLEDFEALAGPVREAGEELDDIDTLGGLVYALAGRIPARGELISHPTGLEFEVVDADPRRIRRLRIRRAQRAEKKDAPEGTTPPAPPADDHRQD